MFELSTHKQALLTPLLTVAGAVDKKQSVSILSNILLKLDKTQLILTATDLEIEITCSVLCNTSNGTGVITVPTKKMLEIIRSLEDNDDFSMTFEKETLSIKQGRSKFKLSTRPADDFPNTQEEVNVLEFSISKNALTHLFQSTAFAMSQQDVRVFLNGLLLEMDSHLLSAVAMDGHRMAICRTSAACVNELQRILLPRRSVQEILRLLNNIEDESLAISVGRNHFKLVTSQYTFSTKLIEARFPPYIKAIPIDQDKVVLVNRDLLKRALSRIIILAHEKYKAVVLQIQPQVLTLIANNQEQEEAVESLEAVTEGEPLTIGLNASYLLDVIHHLPEGNVKLSFSTVDSSILVESQQDNLYQYIIMPMKI